MTKWYNDKYWHQDLGDLWTIPHTIFGVTFAFVWYFFEMNMLYGLIIVFVFAVLWEVAEIIAGIAHAETVHNKISDVVVATAGYALAWWFITKYVPTPLDALPWVLGSVVLLVATSFVGWLGYYLWNGHSKKK